MKSVPKSTALASAGKTLKNLRQLTAGKTLKSLRQFNVTSDLCGTFSSLRVAIKRGALFYER